MDPEGARALARHIAEGKPTAEITVAVDPPRTRVEDGVVYIHPRPVRRQRQVWVYVRGPGDTLQRAR